MSSAGPDQNTMKTIRLLFALGSLIPVSAAPPAALAQTYTWSTLAGLPGPGNSGTNDGTGSAARFYAPSGITVDLYGNVYVADYGNDLIRKLSPNGTSSNWPVVTIAGVPNVSLDKDGTNRTAWFNGPTGIAADAAGNLYVTDDSNSTYSNVRQMTLESGGVWNTVTIISGSAYGLNGIGQNYGIAVDNTGNVLLAAKTRNHVDRVALQGQSWTDSIIAGGGASGFASGSQDGTNLTALFNAPSGVCGFANTNIYVTDANNDTIRQITRYGTNWITTTIAGQVGNYANTDGTNTGALFNGPVGMAIDESGNIFIADQNNNTIRKMTPQGTNWVVATIGGQLGGSPGHQDGVGLISSFYHPSGVVVDGSGNIYVADYANNSIRMGVPSAVTNSPPAMQIASGGNAAYVIWPASATGYVLQTSTNLNAGPWRNIASGITTNFVFSGPMTNSQNFYRLKQE